MRIDIEKATARLIFLCWITIFVCLILKFFGFKEFEIPYIDFEINIWCQRIIYYILYYINTILFLLLLVKRKLKIKEYIICLISSSITFTISMFDKTNIIKISLELLSYIIMGFITIKDKWYKIIIECLTISLITMFYQFITIIYKNFNLNFICFDFIPSLILQIDYYALMILTIIHFFKKGGYIYGYWKSILVFLSKPKGFKQLLSKDKTSIQQDKKTNDVGFKLFIVMLSICQIAIVGVSCYFINNVILEYFIIIISFFFMRQCFGKSYHADSVIKCTTLSIMTFVLSTRLSLPIYLTILCNIFIGCLVAYIMHI